MKDDLVMIVCVKGERSPPRTRDGGGLKLVPGLALIIGPPMIMGRREHIRSLSIEGVLDQMGHLAVRDAFHLRPVFTGVDATM